MNDKIYEIVLEKREEERRKNLHCENSHRNFALSQFNFVISNQVSALQKRRRRRKTRRNEDEEEEEEKEAEQKLKEKRKRKKRSFLALYFHRANDYYSLNIAIVINTDNTSKDNRHDVFITCESKIGTVGMVLEHDFKFVKVGILANGAERWRVGNQNTRLRKFEMFPNHSCLVFRYYQVFLCPSSRMENRARLLRIILLSWHFFSSILVRACIRDSMILQRFVDILA